MVECVGLLRDLVALSVLDEVLEGDLAQWVVASSTCWNASTDCLSKLGVRIHELSRLVWHDPLPVEISANAMKDASAFSVSDARRVAFWSIVQQWLSDSSHIAIPKELSIDRLNWPTMKTHFRQWHDLHAKGGARASANDSARDGGSLDLQPAQKSLELVEECLDAVDQALQPAALGGSSIGDDVPGREPCIGNQEAYRKDLAPGEKSHGTKKDDELTIDYEPNDDDRVVEIRSSSDPKLVRSLDQQLSDCRVRQGSLALVVARTLHRDPTPHPEGQLAIWQRFFVEHLRANSESDELRGFVTSEGEIAMLLEDLDKPVAAAIVREALQEASAQHRKARGLGAEGSIPLIAGLSFVSGPARSFQIKQLIDAGWRCLEGAANQGSGSVKSLEVY